MKPSKVLDMEYLELNKAVKDGKHKYHCFYIATINLKTPKLRTVVLRSVEKDKNTISFHTDLRSQKINDLRLNNNVSVLFYDEERKIQVRGQGKAIIEENSIENLVKLKKEIQKLNWVHSVITLLDIPLLNSSDEPLIERLQNYSTLSSRGIDKERGFNEILNSPVFRNFVISEDGKTSGIIVYLKSKDKIKDFKSKKDEEIYKDKLKKQNHQNILEIRQVIKNFSSTSKIHLGGIPMIADDMMTFIKNDIIVFGLGVFLFIIATLWYVFRKLIWVIVPISSCFFSVIIMTGLLGLLGWKVTVISSNFIALMLILTMAMNIHISTRYLQLSKQFPKLNKFKIISLTTSKMFWPILYTALTTIFAFLSLVFSEIKPIIDFGFMMTFGLIISFLITFSLLPTLINLINFNKVSLKEEKGTTITNFFSSISVSNQNTIFGTTLIIIFLSILGISKLEVENSFINYFNKKTEIYKGMKLIDDKLGGTTPLDIIIKFPVTQLNSNSDEEDDWDDLGEDDNEKYWFTKDKIDKIDKVHKYLETLPAVGKVLSFSSIIDVATNLNNNKPLGSLEMGVLYSKVPESIRKEIVDPYISIENSEARINLRVKDSLPELRRNDLINQINTDLEKKLGFKKDEYKLAGVLILFNNLLQSLFKSQILTLGFVMIGIFVMFLILFRNSKLSLIGVIPNFIAAFFILGIIGLLNIPLDMMTITIAAITIGIAVDNSIHYIYRFREEYKKIKDYERTITYCHSTVGIAILNTSITIVFGFSILIFSNFIPTIYFGIFTGIAMLLAMISVLTLLPALLIKFKPFGLN